RHLPPLLDPTAALLVSLRVGIDHADLFERDKGGEAMVDGHVHLRGDRERVLRQAVKGLAHPAGLGVLDRDDAIAPPGCYARKDAVDGRLEDNGFAPEPERE